MTIKIEIGTYYGKPIDEKMSKAELLKVIEHLAEDNKRTKQAYENYRDMMNLFIK
jgi:hypothetical protein